MSSGTDVVKVIELAYRLDKDDAHWLQDLIDVVTPAVGGCLSMTGYTLTIQPGERPKEQTFAAAVTDLEKSLLFQLRDAFSPEALHSLFNPRLTFATLSETFAGDPASGAVMSQYLTKLGIGDLLGLVAFNPTGSAVVLSAALKDSRRTTRAQRARWARIMAHVAAGYRMREVIDNPSAVDEAVLTPDGRCLHAEAPAKSKSAREQLRRAAKAMDKARGRMRSDDPQSAIEFWRALVSGRWSLVDQFDSDGRRFLIARRNDPAVRDPRSLTKMERQVVAYVAGGQSNKLVAYTLGISPATVASHLSRALRKLGVKSKLALIERYGRLVQQLNETDSTARDG